MYWTFQIWKHSPFWEGVYHEIIREESNRCQRKSSSACEIFKLLLVLMTWAAAVWLLGYNEQR